MGKTVKSELSISKTVNEILSKKPYIQDLFKIDAVNYSGLARYLVPEVKRRTGKENINTDAVIMAVKRFGDYSKGTELSESVRKVLSECSLFARNDLVCLTVKKSKLIYGVILDLQNTVDYVRGDILCFLQSAIEIEIITERKIANELLKRIADSDIIHKSSSLALIGVKKPDISTEVPGIIYCFSKILAMHGITIVDLTCTYMELNFVVHEDDVSEAYALLESEIKKHRY